MTSEIKVTRDLILEVLESKRTGMITILFDDQGYLPVCHGIDGTMNHIEIVQCLGTLLASMAHDWGIHDINHIILHSQLLANQILKTDLLK